MDDQTTRTPSDGDCPSCGMRGKAVSSVTIESLVTSEAKERVGGSEGYRFCAEPGCEVVYFGAEGSDGYTRRDLRVRVGLKETTAPRPLCYCFGYSVEDVEAEVASGAPGGIRQAIVERCRLGEDRCEETNPQGTCCLGNVGRLYKRVPEGGETEAPAVAPLDCCAAVEPPGAEVAPPGAESHRAGWASGGAVLAAVLSSACCWLPLLLLTLGASAAGVAGFFESVRPYFLAVAGILLAVGFYLTYSRGRACEPGEVCDAPASRGLRFQKTMLWAAAILALLFAAFPTYVEQLVSRGGASSARAPAGDVRVYRLDGMTCEGCATGLAARLREVPGVSAARVDYEASLARVEMAPERDEQGVVDAITAAGFQVRRDG